MIGWIDIVSPRLRKVHQQWLWRRGPALIPHMEEYEAFSAAARAAEDFAIVMFMSSDQSNGLVMQAGDEIQLVLPGLAVGKPFGSRQLPRQRIGLALWPAMACKTGQPLCERGLIDNCGSQVDFEVLTLPFANNQEKTGMVYTVFDIPRTAWRRTEP